jgi:uridine phosphorylase
MRLGPDDVAPNAVLVGDPGRIDLFSAYLPDAREVSTQRGLRAITGTYGGSPVTVAAFGMGAPIAAVVLEELAGQGVVRVLRAGTGLTLSADLPLGSFIVAHGAHRAEGTSLTYAPPGFPAVADHVLTGLVIDALVGAGLPHRVGLMGSLDGFFTEMVAARPDREPQVSARLEELRSLGVLAVDMETSALLVAGARLRVAVGSLCLVSVAADRGRLDDATRLARERDLAQVALRAITTPDATTR